MAVAITNATWAGSLANASEVTISGSGFGSHALSEVVHLGAGIEAGTLGNVFTPTNWSHDGANIKATHSNAVVRSGTKSLEVVRPNDADWTSGFKYAIQNPVSAGGVIYVTYWVSTDKLSVTSGQWKNLRVTKTADPVDQTLEVPLFRWIATPQLLIRSSGTGGTGASSHFPNENTCPAHDGSWTRQELTIQASDIDTANGNVIQSLYNGSAFNSWNSGGNDETHSTGDGSYGYVQFQNYFGNSWTVSNAGGPLVVYMDDIYIQTGTTARVELAEASTWAARTTSEIQVPTVWADGSVTVTVNQGAYGGSETAYLYVIDSAGLVNANGFAVTFGATTGLMSNATIGNMSLR